MKRLAIWMIVLTTLGISFGGEVVEGDDGVTFYTLTERSYDGEDVLSVLCVDLAVDNDMALAGDAAGQADFLSGVEADFDTDLVFLCTGSQIAGNPYFFPTDFVYVVDGTQYDLGFEDYGEVEGSAGELREGASVRIAVILRNAVRGEEVDLYYGEDSVSFTIENLPVFDEASTDTATTPPTSTVESSGQEVEIPVETATQAYNAIKEILEPGSYTEELNLIRADGLIIRFGEVDGVPTVFLDGENQELIAQITSLLN